MIPTKPSDDIEDALDFLRRVAGDDVARDREGASREDVGRLTTLVGLPLPDLYIGYLREFGLRCGRVSLWSRGSDIKSLLKFYRNEAPIHPALLKDKFVLADHFGINGYLMLHYLPNTPGGNESRVVMWNQTVTILAASFRNYLYRTILSLRPRMSGAFLDVETVMDDERGLEKHRQCLTDETKRVLQNFSFQEYWFNDEYLSSFEHIDGSFVTIEAIGDRFSVGGEFSKKRARDAIQKELLKVISVRS